MHVVSIVNQKGGVGRSTLAVNLAVTAARRGLRVAIVDLDPQATVSGWWETRRGEVDPIIVLSAPATLDSGLERLAAEGCGLAVLDTRGVNGVDTLAAVRASDFCLVPLRPSVADVRATMPTVRALTVSGAAYGLVVNQAPPRLSARLPGRPVEGPVLPASIGARIDFQYAFAMGLGVDEYAPDGKAAREMADLWDVVRRRLAADTEERRRLTA